MAKFQVPNSITFRDMIYYPVTDGQTESDTYEPSVLSRDPPSRHFGRVWAGRATFQIPPFGRVILEKH